MRFADEIIEKRVQRADHTYMAYNYALEEELGEEVLAVIESDYDDCFMAVCALDPEEFGMWQVKGNGRHIGQGNPLARNKYVNLARATLAEEGYGHLFIENAKKPKGFKNPVRKSKAS